MKQLINKATKDGTFGRSGSSFIASATSEALYQSFRESHGANKVEITSQKVNGDKLMFQASLYKRSLGGTTDKFMSIIGNAKPVSNIDADGRFDNRLYIEWDEG